MFERIASLLCGAVYIAFCITFYLNYLFDVGKPLDTESVFIAMMCLGGYFFGQIGKE